MTVINDTEVELTAFINEATQQVSEQDIFLTHSVVIDLEQLINNVSDLVSLPEVYLKIRNLMDDLDSDIDDFAAVVNTDPGLAASVLKVVNSAFFGFPGRIENISRALNLIGIGQLHDLVLSISAVNTLSLSNDIEPLSTFWRRSIYCGVLSRLFAQQQSLKDAEGLFVIGLLHEIGRLILFTQYPNECKQAIIQAQSSVCALNVTEKALFGFNYADVGQVLMKEWNLPSKFSCVTGLHVHPEIASDYSSEGFILHIAHQMACNKYPGPDGYQYVIQPELMSRIQLDETEIQNLCEEADIISSEMESFILA
jgi:HD-like signal output (HDOD) protein